MWDLSQWEAAISKQSWKYCLSCIWLAKGSKCSLWWRWSVLLYLQNCCIQLLYAITDLVNKDEFWYTWYQTTAKRGANEIIYIFCIYFRVKEYLKDHKCITLFSDNCLGQKKNRYLYLMMSLLTLKMQKLKEIQSNFLEKGHTQTANGSMHCSIEQAKRGVNIFHPYQWEAVMQFACKSKPYNIKVMKQEKI